MRLGKILAWAIALLLVLVLALFLIQLNTSGGSLSLPSPFATPTPASSSPACANQRPTVGVYRPDRLVLKNPCATVTGVVELVRAEPDGDFHIRLRLDPGQDQYLNDKNLADQHGDLVIEIVCVNRVTQVDAEGTCATAPAELRLSPPRLGQHISATGPFVLDTTHGWLEIHPVYGWEAQ